MATPSNESRLLSQREIATAFGVSQRHFRDRHQRWVPDELMVRKGPAVAFRLEAVSAIAAELVRQAEAAASPDSSDGLLFGGDSPALERYRAARAKQEEIKLSQMRTEFASVSQLQTRLDAGAAIMRNCIEGADRRFGREFGDFVRDHVVEWGATVGAELDGDVDRHPRKRSRKAAAKRKKPAKRSAAKKRGAKAGGARGGGRRPRGEKAHRADGAAADADAG